MKHSTSHTLREVFIVYVKYMFTSSYLTLYVKLSSDVYVKLQSLYVNTLREVSLRSSLYVEITLRET